MPITLNQSLNSTKQSFTGSNVLSSLNSAYLNTLNSAGGVVSSAGNAISNAAGNIVKPLKPSNAYIQGVGTVPSGYFLPGSSDHGSEDRIIKKTPLTGARIMADKIVKDIFVYAPKGMQGSKNSNFYEYLSLGIIPYILGSAGLIATSALASKYFNPNDAKASRMMSKNVAMGVILYAVMKWLGNKAMNVGTHAITGADPEMPYERIIKELPENGQEMVRTEFHRVFESVDFPRWDLINKMGEAEGNRHKYYDKIAKDKLGAQEPLNDPGQVVQPLIVKAMTKNSAARSISSFLWAATGVAIAAQKPFSEFMDYGTANKPGILKFMKDLPVNFAKTFAKSVKALWNGASASSKLIGRGLIIASIASTVLGLLNVKRGYKIDKEPSETKIDYTKDYVEN